MPETVIPQTTQRDEDLYDKTKAAEDEEPG
jgi:hypothetical protein